MVREYIEDRIGREYPHINLEDHIWQELVNNSPDYGPGWYDLIIELVLKIEEIYKNKRLDIKEFEIFQVKEKYGSLRFYTNSSLAEVNDLISEYEDKSEKICEKCSMEGKIRAKDGWFMALCDICAEEDGSK